MRSRGALQARAGHYHSRVEQTIGDWLHVMTIDPAVPDLHLSGLANLAAREHTEPDALSEIKSGRPRRRAAGSV